MSTANYSRSPDSWKWMNAGHADKDNGRGQQAEGHEQAGGDKQSKDGLFSQWVLHRADESEG